MGFWDGEKGVLPIHAHQSTHPPRPGYVRQATPRLAGHGDGGRRGGDRMRTSARSVVSFSRSAERLGRRGPLSVGRPAFWLVRLWCRLAGGGKGILESPPKLRPSPSHVAGDVGEAAPKLWAAGLLSHLARVCAPLASEGQRMVSGFSRICGQGFVSIEATFFLSGRLEGGKILCVLSLRFYGLTHFLIKYVSARN